MARLIVHGGKAGARDAELRRAVDAVRAAGHELEVRVTWEAGDARRLAREAARERVDTLVAGGGDGTVHEVVRGLAEDRDSDASAASLPALSILPLGTANDLATAAGLSPEAPLEAALHGALESPVHSVDLGWVDDRPFLNVATGGSSTRVTVETPDDLKRILGPVAYGLTGIARAESLGPVEGEIRGDGLEFAGRFLVLAVGNGRCAGGGLALCPDAKIDDGLLDVTLLTEVPDGERLTAFINLVRDGRDGLDRWSRTARIRSLDVHVPAGLEMNLDGEPMRADRLRIEVTPGVLRLRLPFDSPLLARDPSG